MNMTHYKSVIWMLAMSLSFFQVGGAHASNAEDVLRGETSYRFDLLPPDAAVKMSKLMGVYSESQHVNNENGGGWDLVFNNGGLSWFAEYPDGICVNFYPNGYPLSFTRIENGRLVNEMKRWDNDGHLIMSVNILQPWEVTFSRDRAIWGAKYMRSTGSVQYISNREGPGSSPVAISWVTNLNVLPDLFAEKIHRVAEVFPRNTCLRDSSNSGFDLVYSEDNKLSWYAEYKNNLLDGAWVTFHSNGVPRVLGRACEGKLIGELKIWDATGELMISGEYHKPAALSECLDHYLPPQNLDSQ